MASGDLLHSFVPDDFNGPTSNYANRDQIAAATGIREVLDFDDTTNESAISKQRTLNSNYSGGGLTCKIKGSMSGANTGTKVVKIALAIERIANGDALGSGGSDFAAANTVEITVDNTQDDEFQGTITFTSGADMDSLAAGESFRIEVERQNTGLSGTNATGDFQLSEITISET